MARSPLGILAYRAATAALSPAAPMLLRRRGRQGKEHRDRAGERLGYADAPRPDGKLVWVHGASNGESLAALPLVEALTAKGVNVLMTSGTVTSAEMMQARLPNGAVHQFVPIDTPSATQRFLSYWKPDAGLFVDSDLWPNLILGAKAAGAKLALVNARMSQRSFEGWRWAKKTVGTVLSAFDVCLAQDDEIAARFRILGAPDVRVVGSLKEDAPPLPFDAAKLAELRAAIGGRPVLLAAQTHPGEDETILPAHDALRRTFHDLLTIIVPRHPARGADIAMLCDVRKSARRATGEAIAPDTAVYVADTMGELGLFYRLAPLAFVGGTLVPVGGHNPLEPARLGCAVMAGSHTFNSVSAYAAIFAAQGLGLVQSSTDIAALAARVLGDAALGRSLGEAAARGAASLGGAMEKTVAVVESFLADHARA
jgi:3-deoxy-D-manno-octulosonic-acid transferase